MANNKLEVDFQRDQSDSLIESSWLDSEQAATFLKVSVETLRNFVSNGQVPYYKFGRRNRYILSELDQLLRSNPRGERCEHQRK
jgi:excisionase family DNA binding protein